MVGLRTVALNLYCYYTALVPIAGDGSGLGGGGGSGGCGSGGGGSGVVSDH